MIFTGFTRDIEVTAPRRADKPTPWLKTATLRRDERLWLDDAAFIELRAKHGTAVCDVTPNFCSMVWGWSVPQRVSMLQVVDCPVCNAGQIQRMTTCPMCKGATRVYNL